MKFEIDRCILTEGGTDENHSGQNLPDKRPQNPGGQLREIFNRGFVRDFCTKPTKNQGIRDVRRTFEGGSGMCVKM